MTKDTELDRVPNPVDRHVGLRIRLRRKELGVSQEKLAESIGLTFQQIQKYERAANRVSASKLWDVARALRTSISYFYEGLGDPAAGGLIDGETHDDVHEFLLTAEGMELATLFPRIGQPRVRRRLLDLVRTMAEESAFEDSAAEEPGDSSRG